MVKLKSEKKIICRDIAPHLPVGPPSGPLNLPGDALAMLAQQNVPIYNNTPDIL
jgi:hypothetical protein